METRKWTIVAEKLPQPTAYGVSVSYKDRVICVGGDNGKAPLENDTYSIEMMTDNAASITMLPPLPTPCTQMCGAIVGDTLYIAGGQDSFVGVEALRTFWSLNLGAEPGTAEWESLDPWPGAERMQSVAAAADGHFYMFGGVQLTDDGQGAVTRVTPYLKDAFRFSAVDHRWSKIDDVPRSLAAAPSPAPVIGGHIFLLGGVDGSLFTADPATHPGFSHSTYTYNPVIGRWVTRSNMPDGVSRVTAPAVQAEGRSFIVSGESRPGIRSPSVYELQHHLPKRSFGATNWCVVAVYILSLVLLGAYFATRERSVDDYFTASGRVPWWAAGLSVFATMLSAITYLSIPAKTFAENWTLFPINCGILLIAPLVVLVYLPFFRRLSVASAYEYLERRFSVSVRIFGSLSFILFQIGRMGVVVLLPALALSAVTGIECLRVHRRDRSTEHDLHGLRRDRGRDLDGRHSNGRSCRWSDLGSAGYRLKCRRWVFANLARQFGAGKAGGV